MSTEKTLEAIAKYHRSSYVDRQGTLRCAYCGESVPCGTNVVLVELGRLEERILLLKENLKLYRLAAMDSIEECHDATERTGLTAVAWGRIVPEVLADEILRLRSELARGEDRGEAMEDSLDLPGRIAATD